MLVRHGTLSATVFIVMRCIGHTVRLLLEWTWLLRRSLHLLWPTVIQGHLLRRRSLLSRVIVT